jgi:hypothetical protein
MSAARAQSVDTHLSLMERLRDAARPAIVNAKQCKHAAKERASGWTCQSVDQ